MEKFQVIQMTMTPGIDVRFDVDEDGNVTVVKFDGVPESHLNAMMHEIIPDWAIEAIKRKS